MAVGFNDHYVVSGSSDKLVKFWDFHSGDFRGETFHQGVVERLKVVGDKVFTASSNKSIYVICIENGNFQTILRLKGHFRMVSALDADQRYVLSGSVDKTVRLWTVQKDKEGWSHKQEAIFRGHFIKVSDVKICYPHGVSVSWDGTLRIWDLIAQNCLRIVEHRFHVECVSISSRWVITSDEDSTVFVFSWEACLDPGLPQIIGVRSEERKDIGVRCLNTYSGEIVSVQAEDAGLVTLVNTGDTSDTIEGRIVIQDFWQTSEKDFFHERQWEAL
eukprot:TRINITY_DN33824_c0_g1_i1.p1 TRINITY_DN33824_c0_g1~~TRINITY_DN33824_c0_g1_i1.p1  ORF type:complete len:287 (+),score=55.30 TRINITY_DN33824_c0_g1_i1:40-861(+)